MKSDIIIQLHKNFEDYARQAEGEEFWFARDLMGLLGYAKWENFAKVVDKAKIACLNAGHSIEDHFPDVRKTIPMPKGAEKEIDDLMLTRDAALFGGRSTQHMKDRLGVPDSRALADFLPTITIKAKDFATEITNFNIRRDDLRQEGDIAHEHVKNNQDVRKVLTDRGIKPEALPPAEDIKKLERRVKSEEKQLTKQTTKPKRLKS